MQSDDPPFLCLGTEVSAKFKGAFCEAKVKKLVKSIRCKVNLGSEHGSIVVEDKDIKGTIVLNGNVDVMQGKHLRAGIIQHIKDCSQYTVVFNDGDERNLRRTQVCLKSGRHFEPEVSLDSLPLYNPEHFSNPVMHGNKKRNRQMSVERTPRKRKTKDEEDEDEDDEMEKRKKRKAASVAAAAMADQGGSTESGEERGETGESEDESDREKSEKKKKMDKMKSPEATPAKKKKEERDEEKRKKEKEKEEERKKKEKEDKKKEKDEERRKDEKKEKKEKKEEKVEKEDKKSKSEEKTEKVKLKDASPKKDKEKEKEKSESSTKNKDRSIIDDEIKKPGVAVVVTVRKDRESITYYPALTSNLAAYEKYCPQEKQKTLETGQLVVKSLVSDGYVRVSMSNCVPFESFDMDNFDKIKMTNRLKTAITLAKTWNKKKRFPKEWKLAEVFGDEEAKRMEKEKLKKLKEEEKRKEREEERKNEEEKKKKEDVEGKKRQEEEERKKKDEEERKRKEKEDEKKEKDKEKEKEKEKKAKKAAEAESSSEESESSDEDEADNQERDIFTAQLYKFHEERNTPINKAPVWGGKDLDLHKLYRYVIRYGGSKKCTDASLWKKILMKLKLGGTGAQPVNVKKAYLRYLNEFHSTYSQLGWSLDDLSTKIVSGGRSARKVIDYGFRKRRREHKEKGQTKRNDKDESIRSEGTVENEEEGETRVKKEEEDSIIRPMDASSTETNSRRSLSRITHSESPMPTTSTTTPMKRVRKGKGSKEESVVRTVSECTEPALTPAVGEDAVSTVSSSVVPSSTPFSSSPTPVEGSSWAHDDVKDDYLPANILSNFYQGMTVRALHSGQWYAARVVQVQQPSIKAVTEAIDRAAGGVVKREPGEAFGFTSLDELREMSKKIRCLVHYLGWNSRYDEHMRLPQIRISLKDDEASMKMARPRLNEDLLGWVAKWSRTREGMTALCGPLESPKDSLVMSTVPMGGYRPRRVSFSQYEQLSTSATSPMGEAVSPSISERERKERKSEEKGEKMKSEEREEERRQILEESRKSVTPAVEKKEKKKSTKEEKEGKEYGKEEKDAKDEIEKHADKKEKEKEKEEEKSKAVKSPKRTPSPNKLSSLVSSVDATPVPPPVPPPVLPTPVATPSSSVVAPSTSAAAAVEEKVEKVEKKSCSISDTIDEVVLLLGSRAEKEKKEREERERREQKEAERARKEKEAVVALIATVAAKQKADEEAAGPSREKEEDHSANVAVDKSKEEEKSKKEVRFEKMERKKGGKDKEREEKEEKEPEGKTKKKKEDEKDKKKGGKKVEKKKEEDEDMEDEEFERLHKEAQALGVPLPDLPDEPCESGEKMEEGERKETDKTASAKDETEEKYQSDSSVKTISTTIDKSAPPSTGKGKKRKKKGNQSNMVLDRKYSKRSKKDEEDDSDEEDAAVLSERPPHASLSVLKTRMLKAMEADGSLRDFSPIGLPHITHSNLYGEKVACNWEQLEKHAEELREYYYGVRAELAKLEKRNKATIKRRMEKDRAEREVRKAAKEAAAAAAVDESPTPSTSAEIAALNAEI